MKILSKKLFSAIVLCVISLSAIPLQVSGNQAVLNLYGNPNQSSTSGFQSAAKQAPLNLYGNPNQVNPYYSNYYRSYPYYSYSYPYYNYYNAYPYYANPWGGGVYNYGYYPNYNAFPDQTQADNLYWSSVQKMLDD